MVHQRDQMHQRAVAVWGELRQARRDPFTTSLVIAESHGLITRRLGIEAGLRFLDAFAGGRARHVVWVDEELAWSAVDHWFRRHRDKAFRLTGAVSFEVMDREGLREAFTFDRDFEQAGFRLLAVSG